MAVLWLCCGWAVWLGCGHVAVWLCRPPAELWATLCGIAAADNAVVDRATAAAAIDLVRAAAELGFEPRPPTPPPTPGAAGAAGGKGGEGGEGGVFVAGGGFVDTAAPSDPLQVRQNLAL